MLLSVTAQGQIDNVNIYFTVLGHLPEFCLGMYIAKYDDAGLHIPPALLLTAIALFVLGNLYPLF